MNVDMVNKPPFGFAGLELVRQAQASKETQKPEVHMLGSDSAHIALAAPVIKNETVVAVIVTSVDVGALQKTFKATVASEKGGWLSLKQGGLVVVTGGDKAQHKGAVLNGGVVGGTAWKITINKESVELPISKEDLLTYVIALTLVVIVFGGLAILFSDQERREKINESLKKRSKAKEDKKAQAAAKAEEEFSSQQDAGAPDDEMNEHAKLIKQRVEQAKEESGESPVQKAVPEEPSVIV